MFFSFAVGCTHVKCLPSEPSDSPSQCLQRLAEGRTSLTVAHRLSTVQHCDKICVMANGVVVEEGTHSQLLRAGRVYADMWHAQAQAEQDTELCKPTHLPGAPVDLHLPELATSAMN